MFVDDDAEILRALQRVLRKHRGRWDLVFALGGPAGLDEVRRAPFDVVVSDMRMPVIDGAALLLHVREHDPMTFRMILSGFSDQSATTRAVPLAHQFFDKPCDLQALCAAIDRACRLRAVFIEPRVRAVAERVANLPPPHVYHELTALGGRPNPSYDAIATIIEGDPAMAARVLRVAKLVGVTSISELAAKTGLDACAGLALFSHALDGLVKPIVGFSTETFEQRAIDAAMRAGFETFTLELVRELGIALIAAGMPEQHAAICRELETPGARRATIERELLGATHAEVGAYMLAAWCIPLAIVDAVAFP